jgi:DNA-binding transcriptional MocR family regulator
MSYSQNIITKSNEMINFCYGYPPNNLLPIEWFQSACHYFSHQEINNDFREILQYGKNNGYDKVRELLAEWLTGKYYDDLSTPSLNVAHEIKSDQLLMTNGNTGALHLLMSKYTESTDHIIVENPTYFMAKNIFNEYGLNVEGINMESDGINISELEEKIKKLNDDPKYKQTVLFLYMIPIYHNPTGITTSHQKRKKLAELCDKYDNFYIIADEIYYFLTFEDSVNYYPMADYHPKIISMGSFSKILSPALRVGWIYQNNELPQFEEHHSFIDGKSGLCKSYLLLSSGGMNPISFKFVEHALTIDDTETRPIDNILKNYIDRLENNCNIMMEYLENFDKLSIIKPKGGYFLWIKLKTIKSSSDFLKLCELNKIKFLSGSLSSVSETNIYDNYVRLSFSCYNSEELLIGLERLIECINKYNKINIKIMGGTGKIGSIIKKHIYSNTDFNYLGDIKRNLNIDDFRGLLQFNTVLVDVSHPDATEKLLSFLIENNIYLPLIIGTRNLTEKTLKYLEKYSENIPVATINNFSEGTNILNQFTKITSNLGSEWNIQSTSSTNENIIELYNGNEKIQLIHFISNIETIVDGCINYIYWILYQQNDIYDSMVNNVETKHYNIANDSILVVDLEIEIPEPVINYILKSIIKTDRLELSKIVLLFNDDNKFSALIYQIKNNNFKQIEYCGYSLMATINYIRDNLNVSEGEISVDNIKSKFKIDNKYKMLKLPENDHINSNNDSITNLISEMTPLTLLGISKYSIDNVSTNILIVEINDNVFESNMLDTISSIIYSELTPNYLIAFIKCHKESNKIDMRCFDYNSEELDSDMCLCSMIAVDYYIYHFIKNYKEITTIKLNLINNLTIKIVSQNYDHYYTLN